MGHTANGLLASGGLASESEHPPENTRTRRPITKKRKQWPSSENRECYFKSMSHLRSRFEDRASKIMAHISARSNKQ